jgi:hypothetical protein
MAENKTKPTPIDPLEFLKTQSDPQRHADCLRIIELMRDASGEVAVMWGPAIIGFGKYAYHYESGRKGEAALLAFSPRKSDLTLYIMPGTAHFPEQLSRLGKHKTGGACLYIKKLADIDEAVLREILDESVMAMESKRVR